MGFGWLKRLQAESLLPAEADDAALEEIITPSRTCTPCSSRRSTRRWSTAASRRTSSPQERGDDRLQAPPRPDARGRDRLSRSDYLRRSHQWCRRPAGARDSPSPSIATRNSIARSSRSLPTRNGDAVVVPSTCVGGTDNRFLRQQGIPAYGFIPCLLSPQRRWVSTATTSISRSTTATMGCDHRDRLPHVRLSVGANRGRPARPLPIHSHIDARPGRSGSAPRR